MADILIVDDSAVMRKNLKNILIEAGHNVVGEAADGEQAIIAYREVKPDLITMDITMPIMDGIEACKQIVKGDSKVKIIAISALDQKRKVFEALKNGANHYIFKPITKEKVLKIVNEVLITEEISKELGDKEYQKISNDLSQESSPFAIKNNRGRFIISISESIDLENFQSLKMAINGFLFIRPLNIIFDFGEAKTLNKSILYELNSLIESIKKVGGKYKAICNNDDFIAFTKDNGSILFE